MTLSRKKRTKELNRLFSKDEYQWHVNKILDISANRAKQLKITWTSTSWVLEWLESKNQKESVCEDEETLKSSYTAGENIKRCRCFGKQSGSSSNN